MSDGKSDSLGPLRREVALLVDFENLYYFLVNHLETDFVPQPIAIEVIKQLKDRIIGECGASPIVMAAYADFANGELTDAWAMRSLVLQGMHARYVLGTEHKNAADMQMSLDALEMMFRNPLLQTFVLLAGDRDYIPLVLKLREYGKEVFVVSFRQNTSGDLREIVGAARMWDIAELVDLELRMPDRRVPKAAAPAPEPEPTEAMNPDAEHAAGEAVPAVHEELSAPAEPTHAVVQAPFSEPEIGRECSLPEPLRHGPTFAFPDDLVTPDQEDVLETLLEEFSHKNEIWFAPAKKKLGERIQWLSDYQIQGVMNELKDLGCFAVEKRRGELHDFSVIILNYQHPDVIRLLPERTR